MWVSNGDVIIFIIFLLLTKCLHAVTRSKCFKTKNLAHLAVLIHLRCSNSVALEPLIVFQFHYYINYKHLHQY